MAPGAVDLSNVVVREETEIYYKTISVETAFLEGHRATD